MILFKGRIRWDFIFIGLTILLVGLAIVGGIRDYSPVPYWDMWDGYLDFYLQSSNWSAWWQQHNEHRIFLAKILFWIDIKYFGGLGLFLIVLNYFFIAAIAITFIAIFLQYNKTIASLQIKIIFSCALAAWLFSWMQKENLTWAFQSQFFLAQLLPLCAFYYFSRAISQATFGFDFLLSCLLGFLSSLTMASGLLALPFLCMFCLISKQHLARLVVLSLLTIGSFICYFYGYVAVSGHGSPLQTFIHQPVEFMLYIFKYLGSPIAYLFKGVIIGKVLAVIAGVFLVLNYLYFGVSLVRVSAGKSWNLQRALICFGLYICTTAAVTAGGRLVFGTDQAFSGRYTTPALMAWAALFILYSPFILSKGQDKKWVFVAVFFLFFVSLFPQQLTAIRSDQDKIFEKSLAALALSLGVPDEQQISKVFPAPGYALMLSQKAMHEKITIFGAEPLIGLSEQLESNVSSVSYEKCKGGLEQVSALEGSKYSKISGWIYESKANDRPDLVLIIDGQGKIIGYGVAGQHWSIPSRPLGSPAERSDFSGYVLTKDIVGSTEINITSPFCNLKLN